MTVDPSASDAAAVPDTSPLPSSVGAASPSTLGDLADAIVSSGVENSGPDTRPTDGAVLRYGKITAVGTGTNVGRAQTDATGAAWVVYDNSYAAQVGDLVYLLMQGPVVHIGGQLGGTQPTPPPVGVIHPYAGATAPLGWLLCNGQAVSRVTYPALFAVCGTTYGSGDGSSTFNIPNLVDRVPTGIGTKYLRGETGGSETFTLATANLPSHSHTINHDHVNDPHSHTGAAHTHDMSHDHTSTSHTHSTPSSGSKSITQGASGTVVTVADNVSGTTGSTLANTVAFSGSTASAGGSGAGQGGSTTNNTQTYTGSSGSTGSGTAVNNMPPYLGILYILRALP